MGQKMTPTRMQRFVVAGMFGAIALDTRQKVTKEESFRLLNISIQNKVTVDQNFHETTGKKEPRSVYTDYLLVGHGGSCL